MESYLNARQPFIQQWLLPVGHAGILAVNKETGHPSLSSRPNSPNKRGEVGKFIKME